VFLLQTSEATPATKLPYRLKPQAALFAPAKNRLHALATSPKNF
jgi:hypothetical protein